MVVFVDDDSPLPLKRKKSATTSSLVEPLPAVLKLGREFRVFDSSTTPSASQLPSSEEEDFYDFTAEDYYRLLATQKEDKYSKTKKVRDAEDVARRSKIASAIIRVRFPDNHTLEVGFHSTEKIQSLFDFLTQVVARPDLPFYLYTTPPKKRVTDLSQDFYSAGFVPGAILYFSYDLPHGEVLTTVNSGPFL